MPVTETIDLLARLGARRRRVAVGRRRQPRPAGAVRPPRGRGRSTALDRGRGRCSSTAAGPRRAPGARRGPRHRGPPPHRRRPPRAAAGRRCPTDLPVLVRPRAVHQGHRPAGRVARRRGPRRGTGRRATMATAQERPSASTPCWRARRWCSSAAAAASARRRSPPRSALAAAVRPAAAGCSCSRSTRPSGSPTRSGVGALGNTATRVPDEAFDRRRGQAARRAVGGDARHQGRLGRADPPPRARRQAARHGARQPAVPEHHRPLRAQPRLHRDGAAARAPRVRAATTSSSSTRRRRATPSTCSTRRAG